MKNTTYYYMYINGDDEGFKAFKKEIESIIVPKKIDISSGFAYFIEGTEMIKKEKYTKGLFGYKKVHYKEKETIPIIIEVNNGVLTELLTDTEFAYDKYRCTSRYITNNKFYIDNNSYITLVKKIDINEVANIFKNLDNEKIANYKHKIDLFLNQYQISLNKLKEYREEKFNENEEFIKKLKKQK